MESTEEYALNMGRLFRRTSPNQEPGNTEIADESSAEAVDDKQESINRFRRAIEAIYADDHLAELSTKYHNGYATDEEYREFREISVKHFTEAHPYIEMEFDPKAELERIKSLHGQEGLQALELFQEKYMTQQAAIVECVNILISDLTIQPDLPLEHTMQIMNAFAAKYGFSPDQRSQLSLGIDLYHMRHARITRLQELYPDPASLLEKLSDKTVEPNDIVRFTTSPLSLDFILTEEKFHDLVNKPTTIGVSRQKFVSETGGAISYTLGYSDPRGGHDYGEVLSHERQHALNSLFQDTAGILQHPEMSKQVTQSDWFNVYQQGRSPELKTRVARNIFQPEAAKWLNRAADEIVAQLRDWSSWESGELDEYLKSIFLNDLDNSYNYPRKSAEYFRCEDDETLFKAYEEARLGIYIPTLTRAIEAMADLYRKSARLSYVDNRFNSRNIQTRKDFVSTLLNSTPLENWPQVAKRVKEDIVLTPIE